MDATAVAQPAPTHCRRFVIGADAPLVRNLAALWAVDAALARRIEALHPTDGYAVQPSRSGPPTVAIDAENGRPLFLHSRYEPVEEARRLIDAVATDDNLAFYVHGFGLGYHVTELFERAAGDALLIVFEPNLRLLRTAFEHHDFTALIESRRVLFFTQGDKADLMTRLTPLTALITLGAAEVAHPPSVQLRPDFHGQFRQWTAEFASFMRTSLNTLVLNGRRTAENIARNVGAYVGSPCVSRLKDRHKGQPAIIVSAGPSLRKNKHLLTDARGKAVIIAVQTMLKPLLEMGVEPDYVTSLDYHEICTRFYEGLPPALRTELVAEPKAAPAIFSMFPGPVTVIGNEYAENLLREIRLDRGRLPSGATVAHLAFYLAEHLGCDPVIFIGQDLGFGDGLCYAPGTSYEDVWRPELGRFCTVEMKQWDQIVRDRHILRKIPDQQGQAMYTEERLFTYLQQFERDFAQTKCRVIDATEGGAAKRGAACMTLADAIAQFCDQPLSAPGASHAGRDATRQADVRTCLERRRDEAQRIEALARQTLPLLREIADHLDDQRRVNRAIARLDAIRAEMNDLGACYDLITQLTQRTELGRFTADRKLSASKIDGAARQRKQVERDIGNCEGVIEAAVAFQRLMDEATETASPSRGATVSA